MSSASRVRVAPSTTPKSSRPSSFNGSTLLRKRSPMYAAEYRSTNDKTSTRSGKSIGFIFCSLDRLEPDSLTADIPARQPEVAQIRLARASAIRHDWPSYAKKTEG